MRPKITRARLLAAGMIAVSILTGCQRADDTIQIGPMPLTEESVAAIRSQDEIVNEEEGGAAKIIRPTRSKKVR